jgi:hypothetical protein
MGAGDGGEVRPVCAHRSAEQQKILPGCLLRFRHPVHYFSVALRGGGNALHLDSQVAEYLKVVRE